MKKVFLNLGALALISLVGDHRDGAFIRVPSSVNDSKNDPVLASPHIPLSDSLYSLNKKEFTMTLAEGTLLNNAKKINAKFSLGKKSASSVFSPKKIGVQKFAEGSLFKSQESLAEILLQLEKSSDYNILVSRMSEYWNFKFFETLPENLSEMTPENKDVFFANYNIETYVAFSFWLQVQEPVLDPEEQEKLYQVMIEDLKSYRESLASGNIVKKDRNDLVAKLESKIYQSMKHSFMNSFRFKYFVSKFKAASKSMKILGLYNQVDSIVGIIKKYIDIYEKMAAIGEDMKKIQSFPVDLETYDVPVEIVVR